MLLKSLICLFPWFILAAAAEASQAKPGCKDTCGNVSIPYPFGVGEPHCYQSGLQLVCNESFNPPRLLYGNMPVVKISLLNGTMTVGLGFNFALSDLLNFTGMEPKIDNYISFPAVLDWVVGVETCEKAKTNLTSYACGDNTDCVDSTNGSGYSLSLNIICGYENTLVLMSLTKGLILCCIDIDECLENPCENICNNAMGSFKCSCPHDYIDEGEQDGKNCIPLQKSLPILQLALVLLLTIRTYTPTGQPCLPTYFPASLKENRLFQLVEPQIINEGQSSQIIAYSELSKRCLSWKGEKRPTMKEIAMELEGLKRFQSHPWTPQRNEESKSLLSESQDIYSIELSFYTGDASGQYSMEVMPIPAR
ncbi:hypothetical protein GIB67_033802 [Kingdonia uniflora]|uniref:EGF-like domain-containing protein n=1 Tax=Kingdonia uniflora TaxID=39325 RepID=A0A7J7P4K2_9MAGN|nr:hypothetical protein GIB67_033802 [Kingdonia uniflora]